MRKIKIYGNWKMNKTTAEAVDFLKDFKISDPPSNMDIGIAAPFMTIPVVIREVKDRGMNVKVGAQNCHYESSGAYTGEVSPDMLKAEGVDFVILGHSERRLLFGEDSTFISKKVAASIQRELEVILCVGETLQEREEGRERKVIEDLVKNSLQGIDEASFSKLVSIAYEPVWAIGTGKNATPQQAGEMHEFIRSLLSSIYSKETAASTTIMYGGSVKPENCEELISENEIDGFLIGGASLKPDSFQDIILRSKNVREGN